MNLRQYKQCSHFLVIIALLLFFYSVIVFDTTSASQAYDLETISVKKIRI